MGEYRSILQVVGFQNSGKTTLMEKLIVRTTQAGLRAASLKHHGHGGAPIREAEAKDSQRHYEAGAVVAGVEGDGVLQLRACIDDWGLEELITFYQLFSIDVLFIEGYKQADYPKVVLIRDEQDVAMLHSLSNVQCVISHVKIERTLGLDYPIFQLEDDSVYIDFLMEAVVKQSGA